MTPAALLQHVEFKKIKRVFLIISYEEPGTKNSRRMKTARGWKSTQMTKYACGPISTRLQVSLLWTLQICCALSRQ